MNYASRWGLVAILLLFSILSPACIGPPDPTFVAAARANHDAMAPEYLEYVEADPGLDEAQRERRRRTVARWDEAIRSREAPR